NWRAAVPKAGACWRRPRRCRARAPCWRAACWAWPGTRCPRHRHDDTEGPWNDTDDINFYPRSRAMEIAALTSTLMTQALPAAEPPAPVAPSGLATARFNAIMNAPESPALSGVSAALQSAFAPAPAAASTLGGQILSGLRGMSADFSDKWQGIARSLDKVGTQ